MKEVGFIKFIGLHEPINIKFTDSLRVNLVENLSKTIFKT